MEVYFNPYPGAAKTEEEGLKLAIGTADALLRLQRQCNGISITSNVSVADGDLPPSKFVIFRNSNLEFTIGAVMYKYGNVEREKLRLFLSYFSKGKIIDQNDLNDIDNWVISVIGTSAPILELAAKNKAIALTIPTEVEWCVDVLKFDNRSETLHNLWGQEDISAIITHCMDSIANTLERFSVRFNAEFCPGTLNSAPNMALWDSFGFFQVMEKARKRNYEVDDNLIKNVADTKYGPLLELRLYGPGHRIFFVYIRDRLPKILIGGFYQKNESLSQDDAIQKAKKCVDNYSR